MRKRRVIFKVRGRLDSAGPEVDGVVTFEPVLDPGIGAIVRVRRARCRREYTATLVGLADLIIDRQVKRERLEKQREKAATRRARRGWR